MSLKPPVWTWEIPAYFFIGGVAGVAAAIAGVTSISGGDATLVRDARWVAAAGAAISPALLISDLGRPGRFLNMLRVFKRRSPMSVGVWGLIAFSAAVFSSIALEWWRGPAASAPISVLAFTIDLFCVVLGLLLTTYTGVLIGATSVPVWARHARLLPMQFGASSLGAGVGVIELLGHFTPAMNLMGIAAAIVATGLGIRLEIQRDLSSKALGTTKAGWLTRIGDLGSGPLALVLRLVPAALTQARVIAAIAAIFGSLCTRYGWLEAGRASARQA